MPTRAALPKMIPAVTLLTCQDFFVPELLSCQELLRPKNVFRAMNADRSSFRPPAPAPQERPLGAWAMLKTLRSNPLECWTKAHFEQPIVLGGYPFARVAVVNDPTAIRQILVENQSAYRKSAIERRVLSARMRNGLVTVDG